MLSRARRAAPLEETANNPAGNFALDVLEGLSASPKRIPSMYLYDARGSELFSRITALPEYYLTRCEAEILERLPAELGPILQEGPFDIIELGAGDGRKTAILIEGLLARGAEFEYAPVDVSRDAMRDLTEHLEERLGPGRLKVRGFVTEYFEALEQIRRNGRRRSLVLFLGSSIGNFDYCGSRRFLHGLYNALSDGDALLIGFDLKKEIPLLERAYRDAEGLTEEFNMNLLERINRELGGRFDRERFAFHSFYNPLSGAVESMLVSKSAQVVPVDGLCRSFGFDAWEPVHTEYSHKYLVSDIEKLASDTGFTVEANFFDARKYFADSVWRVRKGR